MGFIKKHLFSFILIIVLPIIDIIQTYYIIDNGGEEANFLPDFLMKKYGYWAPALYRIISSFLVIGIVCYADKKHKEKWGKALIIITILLDLVAIVAGLIFWTMFWYYNHI